jgi:hypothetical protein
MVCICFSIIKRRMTEQKRLNVYVMGLLKAKAQCLLVIPLQIVLNSELINYFGLLLVSKDTLLSVLMF